MKDHLKYFPYLLFVDGQGEVVGSVNDVLAEVLIVTAIEVRHLESLRVGELVHVLLRCKFSDARWSRTVTDRDTSGAKRREVKGQLFVTGVEASNKEIAVTFCVLHHLPF